MRLVDDWKRVLRKAWSIRLMLLAGVLSAVEVVLPFLQPQIPHGLFAVLSGVTVAAAFIARLVAQRQDDDDA